MLLPPVNLATRRIARAVAVVAAVGTIGVAMAQPSAMTPATIPNAGPGAEAGAPVVDLWPDAIERAQAPWAATRPAEFVEERQREGRRDRMARHVADATLTVFLPAGEPNSPRTAIVLCPGGGYRGLAIDKEGYNTARRFNENGIAVFVLKYRLPGGVPPEGDGAMPLPLQDVRRAIRLVRARAGEWGVNPSRVGIMGFSAGGHLAGSLTVGLGGDAGDSLDDDVSRLSPRPDFAALLYPVISMRDGLAHRGSRDELLGKEASAQSVDQYSLESQVTPAMPPVFIVHARDDKAVPVGNATAFVDAARAAGVPIHLELYDVGGHGFGTGVNGGEAAAWPARFETWLSEIGMR